MTADSAISYFLYDTGDKIIKSDECLEHLHHLETRAENGGFSPVEFSDLSKVLLEKSFPAQLGRRLIYCLVPNEPVKGEDIVELVLWCLGRKSHSPAYITRPVLQVVDLVIKQFLVDDRHLLGSVYELLFYHLSNALYSETLVSILLQLTTRAEINRRRCRIVRSLCSKGGVCFHVNSLLWRFRQLRPDLEPKVPPPTSRQRVPTSVIYKRFSKISDDQCDTLLSGLGWDSGQLSSKIIYKDSMKESLLPTPDYINLQSGMESKKNTKIPILGFQEVDDVFDNLERIDLPNNILSIIGTKVSPNILPRKELIERFSLVLYHTLQKEFLSLPRVRSRKETERRQKRQIRLLEIIRGFQVHCYHGLPIIGRFLTEYLVNWDGENFFTEILGLVKVLQITDFKELYDTVLSQLETNFHNYPLIQKLLVLDSYFELLKFWSSVEYRRFTERRVGLFPDSSSNCDSALAAIYELTNHILEVAVTTLSTAREQVASERGLYTFFTVNRILEAQDLMVHFKVPVRIQLPEALVHESIFSSSSVAFSKVCKYIVAQKNNVIPFLNEKLIHLRTMGDRKSIAVIEPQLRPEHLEPLEFIARDVLQVLSPVSVCQRDGSLFLRSWTPHVHHLLTDGLFISSHPAFLSDTLNFFADQEGHSLQAIWKNLIADRTTETSGMSNLFSDTTGGRVGTNQFYKNRASAGQSVPNPDLDAYIKYVSGQFPEIGEFIQMFRGTPPPPMSIISQDTELTESSGVSSFEPKALKKRVSKQKENASEGRRSSPRIYNERILKRRSDNLIQSTPKRSKL